MVQKNFRITKCRPIAPLQTSLWWLFCGTTLKLISGHEKAENRLSFSKMLICATSYLSINLGIILHFCSVVTYEKCSKDLQRSLECEKFFPAGNGRERECKRRSPGPQKKWIDLRRGGKTSLLTSKRGKRYRGSVLRSNKVKRGIDHHISSSCCRGESTLRMFLNGLVSHMDLIRMWDCYVCWGGIDIG